MLIARIFPRPCGARKNTTQLAKYPRVLYVKPSNKMYVLFEISRSSLWWTMHGITCASHGKTLKGILHCILMHGLLVGQKDFAAGRVKIASSGNFAIGQKQNATSKWFILDEAYLGDTAIRKYWSVQMIFDVMIKREGQNQLCDVLFDYFSHMLICLCSVVPKDLWLNLRNRRNFMRDNLHNRYYFHRWSTGNYVRCVWRTCNYGVFSLTWSMSMFFDQNKRKRNKNRVQFLED